MGMIVVVNTKGGSGKSTTASHLIAPWVFNRLGKAVIIEVDDQNSESSVFRRSSIEARRYPMGDDSVSRYAVEKIVEDSYSDFLIVDVGGNRTSEAFLHNLSHVGADEDIDLIVVPVSGSGQDVDNAYTTIAMIKDEMPDYAGPIALVITRCPTVEVEYVKREVPDAFDLVEQYSLENPIILPQSRLFSGARELELTAWEVGDRFEELKTEMRSDKAAAKKRRDIQSARILARINTVLMEGRRWHDYLNEQFVKLDGILPLSDERQAQGKASDKAAPTPEE